MKLLLSIFTLSILILYFNSHRRTYIENYIENYIPRVIHQTYSTYDNIPECVKDVMEENKSNNPQYTFKFYNDQDIDNYIKYNTSPITYQAFSKLNPKCGACKADFFRYVIIYNEGGIYADIKVKFKVNLEDWIHKNSKLKLTMWPWFAHSNLDKYFHEGMVRREYENGLIDFSIIRFESFRFMIVFI